MVKNKEQSKITFFAIGTAGLVAFALEFLILQCEQFIYDKNYYKFTITESIVHWVLICVVWGMIGLVMFYVAERVYKFDAAKRKNLPSIKGWIFCALLIAVSVALKLFVWEDFKILHDFRNSGWFQFIFQYVYYLFESFMIVLSVTFFQEAFEHCFKKEYIPWGGIVLALTWGLSHIVTQSSVTVGLAYTLIALLFGICYVSAKKNLYISYILITLMFLL